MHEHLITPEDRELRPAAVALIEIGFALPPSTRWRTFLDAMAGEHAAHAYVAALELKRCRPAQRSKFKPFPSFVRWLECVATANTLAGCSTYFGQHYGDFMRALANPDIVEPEVLPNGHWTRPLKAGRREARRA